MKSYIKKINNKLFLFTQEKGKVSVELIEEWRKTYPNRKLKALANKIKAEIESAPCLIAVQQAVDKFNGREVFYDTDLHQRVLHEIKHPGGLDMLPPKIWDSMDDGNRAISINEDYIIVLSCYGDFEFRRNREDKK